MPVRAKMPCLIDETRKAPSCAGSSRLRTEEEFSSVRIASQLFSKALAEQDIPHVFEMYEGGDHVNKIWQRLETRVLPFFSEKLEGH